MHGSADASILDQADETRTLYHNGDDGQALVHGTEADYVILDMIGDFGDDPGNGWAVAGVADATKDHTIVRKSSVCQGNSDFATSAGTTTEDSEWIVYDNNTWDYVGSHVAECASSTAESMPWCDSFENGLDNWSNDSAAAPWQDTHDRSPRAAPRIARSR